MRKRRPLSWRAWSLICTVPSALALCIINRVTGYNIKRMPTHMATLEVALLLLVLILTVCSASASTGCIAGIGGTCQLREETCNEEHDNEWVSPSSAPLCLFNGC